jgi:predicted Zn-dependent protease
MKRLALAAVLCLLGLLTVQPLLAVPVGEDEALTQEILKLNDVVGEDLIEKKIEQLRAAPDKGKKLLAQGLKLAGQKPTPLNYTGAYILGSLAREFNEIDQAQTFFKVCLQKAAELKSERKYASILLEIIESLYLNKQYDEAEKACREFLETDRLKPNPGDPMVEVQEGQAEGEEFRIRKPWIIRRMVQIAALQGKEEEAFRRIGPLLKAAPDNPSILELHGWLLRHTGKYLESAKIYEQLLKKFEGKDEQQTTVRYILTGIYTDLNDVDKATEHLQTLLKKDPDNATYNNDLGYIWADHDRNLDEAEKLIRKALAKDPKNPAYQDSLGWVLFKKKKFDEARAILEEAIKLPDGQHQEILEHLGDIYAAQTKKAEAVAMYRKAVEVATTSKREQKRKSEIEKKIQELSKP